MSKKFKHKYSNDIAELINSAGYKLNKNTIGLIPTEYIENSNDWEEIVEVKKDYEILEFKSNCTGLIHTLIPNTDKYLPNKLDINYLLYDSTDVYIYKIRRLSDGEVFSIGDKVYFSSFRDDKFAIISGIFMRKENVLKFKFEKIPCCVHENLNDLQHYKEPILITEDGVELFEGDKVFGVCIKGSWETRDTFVNSAMLFLQNKHKEKSAWLYFSTKAKALEYIYWNKAEFSRKQLLEILDTMKKEAE